MDVSSEKQSNALDSRSASETFLGDLLGKTLRITIRDTRMFVGEFNCTDSDCNIILESTYEYRLPTAKPELSLTEESTDSKTLVLNMTSRYVGLVVVPGEYIEKIELEAFESQSREKENKWSIDRVGGASGKATLVKTEEFGHG